MSSISENVSLLDSGLTTLAAISAIVVTFARKRLDAEIGLRQCQNETQEAVTALADKDAAIWGWNFELIDGLVLIPKTYWGAGHHFCNYATNNHSLGPCMLVVFKFMDLPGTEHTGQCGEACCCMVSHYVEELEPLLALTYNSSIRVFTTNEDWYVFQCKNCIESKCHIQNSRELNIPSPVPLDLREVTRYDRDSLGEAVKPNYYDDIFTVSHRALLLPIRRNNNARLIAMFGLSLEGMDAVSRNRMHSLTDGLRSVDYRTLDDSLTAAWQTSPYYMCGIHVAEVLVNLFLVFIFRIDPMSSALAARRAVRDFTVDSTGSSVTLGEYLVAVKMTKLDGPVEGVLQLRFSSDYRLSMLVRLIPAAGNVIGLVMWLIMILLDKHPVKWTGGYEKTLPNWALYVLLLPTLLSIFTVVSTYNMFWQREQVLFNSGIRLVLPVMVTACIVLGEILIALLLPHYRILRRLVQASIAILSFIQWQLGITILGKGGPLPTPPSLQGTLIYAQTFVLTGFLAATGGKWQ